MSDIDDVYGEADPVAAAGLSRSKAASSVQSSLYRLLDGTTARGKMSWDAIWLAREGEPGRERKGKNARERLSRLARPTLQLILDACRKTRRKPGKSEEVLRMLSDVETALSSLPGFSSPLGVAPPARPMLEGQAADDDIARRVVRLRELRATGLSEVDAVNQIMREARSRWKRTWTSRMSCGSRGQRSGRRS